MKNSISLLGLGLLLALEAQNIQDIVEVLPPERIQVAGFLSQLYEITIYQFLFNRKVCQDLRNLPTIWFVIGFEGNSSL